MDRDMLLISANVNESNKQDYDQLSTICSVYSGLDIISSQNFEQMVNRYSNVVLLVNKIKLLVMDLTDESIEQGIILHEACNKNISTFIIVRGNKKMPDILESMPNIYGISRYINKPMESALDIANFVKQYQAVNTYKK